ncbi:MAG: hypothetical protein QF535_01985 [Anaerolineales bacterium]|mgnify:FL=1|jgi:hypothetical protein|nr:hypothetical protein [Anaerolineales bacterium]|tara:strand:- start:133 stop:480 length:348 start_codon:yes stop_codon:yes gene_type:complete
MKVPIIETEYTKDQFSKYRKIFPAHELPLYQHRYGTENIEVKGKTDTYHDIENMEDEIKRLVEYYGKETLRTVFGANFVDTVEFSITKIVSKEKNVDGGKNTRKSKDGISTEARI